MNRLAQVVFADASLGGTSRSAIQLGAAWKEAGYEVVFRPQLPVHSSRLSALTSVGAVADASDPLVGGRDNIVHYHHGAWSSSQVEAAHRLVQLARSLTEPPTLLTHNVFGVPDDILNAWPAARIVGVLGSWSAAQYRLASMPSSHAPRVVLVPNPQDLSIFRPATESDRVDARKQLGYAGDERVIVRIGSPHGSKWSSKYVRVVAASPDLHFYFVGCPPALRKSLAALPNVRFGELRHDDQSLRQVYWGADAFLHVADRGESFGNVLLESVLSGVRTVSLARPFRDNTPWEFNALRGFTYARSLSDVIQHVNGSHEYSNDMKAQDRSVAERRYSVGAVSTQLAAAVSGSEQQGFAVQGLRPADYAKVLVRHNPVNDHLKRLRLSVRGV